MLRKLLSLLVLSCFSFSVFALEPTNAVQPIREIISELKEEQQRSAEYIQSLETNNEQIMNDLIESMNSQQRQAEYILNLKKSNEQIMNGLAESMNSQQRQLLLVENFGNLIDDQATYYNSLNRKLMFYRTTSITLSACLLATAGMVVLITQPWNK